MLPGQLAHESTLPHRREPNEANAGDSRPRNIESRCDSIRPMLFSPLLGMLTASTTTARSGCQEFSLQLRKLCLQLSQMVACGLIFLGLGHFGLDIPDL